MKIFMRLAILLMLSLTLTACSSWDYFYYGFNEDKIADEVMQKFINALENENEEALKSLFSQNAIMEAKDFDTNAQKAKALFQGKVTSVEGGMWNGTRQMGVEVFIYFSTKYNIKTKEANYIIDFWNCYMHENHPEMSGVHCIIIANEADKEANPENYYKFVATHLEDEKGIFIYEYKEGR